jgi:hypothetical protein
MADHARLKEVTEDLPFLHNLNRVTEVDAGLKVVMEDLPFLHNFSRVKSRQLQIGGGALAPVWGPSRKDKLLVLAIAKASVWTMAILNRQTPYS